MNLILFGKREIFVIPLWIFIERPFLSLKKEQDLMFRFMLVLKEWFGEVEVFLKELP